jgi:hypothetical protein
MPAQRTNVEAQRPAPFRAFTRSESSIVVMRFVSATTGGSRSGHATARKCFSARRRASAESRWRDPQRVERLAPGGFPPIDVTRLGSAQSQAQHGSGLRFKGSFTGLSSSVADCPPTCPPTTPTITGTQEGTATHLGRYFATIVDVATHCRSRRAAAAGRYPRRAPGQGKDRTREGLPACGRSPVRGGRQTRARFRLCRGDDGAAAEAC